MDRRAITIRGIVQGVGFRPFVHGLAARHGLLGFVRNHTGGVLIEVEGDAGSLDGFLRELEASPPPLSRIDDLSWETRPPRGDARFTIEASDTAASGRIVLAPDAATCADCLAELFDPADRRYRYPFLNCTNCGPRFTIVTAAPYDRERTTMASFVMCAECLREYEDPCNRRFHAEPIACPACGPRLALLDGRGFSLVADDPLDAAASALKESRIVALKGLGGYHLVCTAGDLAVGGARPRYLAAAFILEEGLALADLERIAASMRTACDQAGVMLVTGDTKVVDHGKGDQIFITTTGIGFVPDDRLLSITAARPGDRVVVSGTIGDHGIAIMSVREGIEFETVLESD